MNTSELTGFEAFCGGVFWDLNLTWYTTSPDFTPCFQNSVLYWGPCAWLWLALIPYAIYMKSCKSAANPVNKLNVSKTLISVLLILVSLLDVIKFVIEDSNDEDPPLISLVSPAVIAGTFLLATILIQAERKKGFMTSGVLFIFYTLLLICGIVPFYSKIIYYQTFGHAEDLFRFVTFYIYYGLLLIQFVLSCMVDLPKNVVYGGKQPCPETEASFISRITFWWVNGLVFTGYKKSLEESDIWEPNPRDISRNNAPQFNAAWQEEMQACNWDASAKKKKVNSRSRYGSISTVSLDGKKGGDEKTPLLNGVSTQDLEVQIKDKKTKEPSLMWTLTKVFGPTLLQAQFCKLVADIMTFVGPTLQGYLIGYTEDPNVQQWKGYLYASLFLVSSLVNSVFFHQLFHIGMTVGMRVKAAVIAAVYKKALTMSNEARKDSTVGEIVNLMSVDAQRLQDVSGYIWMVWSCPLQIVIAVYLLWNIMGPSILAGLGVMVLLIPINGVMATIQRKLQIAQMTQKDQRIKLMNEVLNGMKVLKLYAWELSFKEKISAIRGMELETLKKYCYLSAVGTFTWTCAPFLVILATFTTYVLSGNTLDANTAFVSLSLFNILRFPINLLPMMISYLVTASVSVKRIGKFLRQGDLDLDNVSHDHSTENPISIEKGTFAWGTEKDDLPALKNINIKIPEGGLVAVVGQVGFGKSSLLSAMLGEMVKVEGKVNCRGSVAYVAQQAWIQNATVKENITFGTPFDADKYEKVLEACALKPDLEILPGGDMTEIGEKGINLSGGQKQRVSLARAVYNNADIYLLDDPLSAVDSHVGKHIFEQVVGEKGMLKDKTRVLVTHGVQWLPKVDQIVVLVHGEVSEIGSYDELLTHNGPFAQFLKTFLTQEDSDSEEEDPELKEIKSKLLQRVDSIDPSDMTSPTSGQSESEARGGTPDSSGRKLKRRRKSDVKKQKSVIDEKDPPEKTKKAGEKLIQEEFSETGQVKWSVFFSYCRALGVFYTFLMLLFFLLYQGASVASNVWLSEWTEDEILKNLTIPTNSSVYIGQRDLYLGVYGGLGVGQALFVLAYAMFSAVTMVRAARVLHEKMLMNILRAPMTFFDTTPIGRILNRFSRDIETIDNILPQLLRSWMNTFFTVVSTIVVISYSTPIFLAVVIPVGLLYYFVQRFYIPTSRQLKRIESTTRSPIYVHFSETITGASTIRAYNYQTRFMDLSDKKVDHNLVFYFSSIASNRWLGFRLEFLGSLIVFAAAIFAVLSKGSISGGLVGLSISYALQVTQSLNWMVRMTSDLESNIVSVERVKEYSETPTEAEWQNDERPPPSRWPDEGKVAFENFSIRYREGLDLVLKGITVNVEGGSKIGIVGRTGAGKSSLTVGLFRLVESAGGAILIDGIQIAHLGLHQLRSKLTILPQDPVLFSGSLRMNLDPFDQYTDAKIWEALEMAHLKDFVSGLPAGIAYECGEGGQNLSVGQRQLVCLGRTLLHKTKILILDEATAAVDLETDELIQATIKEAFGDCTILTIAHRLNTILDSDKILVLDSGKIAEYDTPDTLLKNKQSQFYAMAKDAGIV